MNRITLALVFVLATTSAYADDVPWAKGVSDAAQAQANELYAQGNDLFAHQDNAGALAKYQAAIALWDHPRIRFNMAVTLIRLDRIVEAADSLDAALKYGDKPFSPDLYQRVLDDQQLVRGRVGELEVSCSQPDVHLLLDGKPLATCPATQKQRVLAGEHLLLAEKKDFMTVSRRVIVVGGKTATEDVSLVPIESAVILKYRYPRWMPYTVAGTGAAIALGGLGFYFAGRSQMDRFEAEFAMQCMNGCTLASQPLLADERSSAKLKGDIGIGMMVGGGAIAIAGVALAVINSKAERILPSVETVPTHGGAITRVGWRF
ncbi:MAG: tetratricopeptide repeat protein [Deltaproteobacteria bacterium]|nr:tetratricopeptide repeat protein [Deltaproteobacteria bacterium]